MSLPVRFGVGVSVDVSSRFLTEEEQGRRRKEVRDREILVGFIMAQAKVSQEDAEYVVSSGLWELTMSDVRAAVRQRRQRLETPVMLTEGTDG